MQTIKSDFKQWIGEQLQSEDFSLESLRSDASFRSYYRVKQKDFSYVVMDAPPEREKTDLFVEIAKLWQAHSLPVPQVFAWEKQKGYVLLSDFGDTLLLDVLNEENVESYYEQAIDLLVHLQERAPRTLPHFDEHYIRLELGLFREWFCEKLLGMTLSESDQLILNSVNQHLVDNCLMQPQVTIHRDYHSRNLMVLNEAEHFGLIDFQDAMIGPITYDLVSILKDCYVQWPPEKIEKWAMNYYVKIQDQHPTLNDFDEFMRWFDWTGLQRHLKVLGIFSRLNLRDNKPRYLHDMPRILRYILDVTVRYEVLAPFDDWLNETILPKLFEVWAVQGIDCLSGSTE